MVNHHRGAGTGGFPRLLLDPAVCATYVDPAFCERRLGIVGCYCELPVMVLLFEVSG